MKDMKILTFEPSIRFDFFFIRHSIHIFIQQTWFIEHIILNKLYLKLTSASYCVSCADHGRAGRLRTRRHRPQRCVPPPSLPHSTTHTVTDDTRHQRHPALKQWRWLSRLVWLSRLAWAIKCAWLSLVCWGVGQDSGVAVLTIARSVVPGRLAARMWSVPSHAHRTRPPYVIVN